MRARQRERRAARPRGSSPRSRLVGNVSETTSWSVPAPSSKEPCPEKSRESTRSKKSHVSRGTGRAHLDDGDCAAHVGEPPPLPRLSTRCIELRLIELGVVPHAQRPTELRASASGSVKTPRNAGGSAPIAGQRGFLTTGSSARVTRQGDGPEMLPPCCYDGFGSNWPKIRGLVHPSSGQEPGSGSMFQLRTCQCFGV